ncbi:MAG: twin-arginine translocation signal domain-containing protein [Verrucomicrobia bacterium]|nr:twin-arginine translocation signal domain-containing protein [Verrucomicrobiota bacterium]
MQVRGNVPQTIRSFSRRQFMNTAALGAAAIGFGAFKPEKHQFIIRFDTESRRREGMKGFFEKVVSVQRSNEIPVSFFCQGSAIVKRESEFRAFHQEINGDQLFDIQDHSYSHVGLGYAEGKSIEVLRADYENSFSTHERVFGSRPIGVSLCGTKVDGDHLSGFDATDKSRAELDMLADMGIRMVNTFHSAHDSNHEFIDYSDLGHPEMMGFPSANSDNGWVRGRNFGDPVEYIVSEIRKNAPLGKHMAIMFHDDTEWIDVDDKELDLFKLVADVARENGYELSTHVGCYDRFKQQQVE